MSMQRINYSPTAVGDGGNSPSGMQQRDPQLWEVAQRRVSFKYHLATYLIINAFLWGVWLFGNNGQSTGNYPWPIWPTAGWGIGLFFHFLGAYIFPKENSVEREYQKLLREKNNL